jgi:hypothetical protein
MRTKSLLAAALFTAGAFAGMTGAAQAAPSDSPIGIQANPVRCADDKGYVMVHNQGRHCFANAGRIDVFITDVYKIDAGNNLITVDYRDWVGNPGATQINKYSTKTFDPRIVVEDITIH